MVENAASAESAWVLRLQRYARLWLFLQAITRVKLLCEMQICDVCVRMRIVCAHTESDCRGGTLTDLVL